MDRESGMLQHRALPIKISSWPDIAVSCEALPVPGKYRCGCSQPSVEQNTRSPMMELEKVLKELKESEAL